MYARPDARASIHAALFDLRIPASIRAHGARLAGILLGMRRILTLCPMAVLTLASVYGQMRVAPRDFMKEGWTALLNGRDLAGWHAEDSKPLAWFAARDVRWNAPSEPALLSAVPLPGGTIVNGTAGRTANLVSDARFGDLELYLEYLLPKGSNSGVYLQGLYEMQIKDSYGVENLTVHDCGAIYERWIDGKGVGGTAPLRNASRPAGEWQSFDIRFRAPRFDASGRKIENARFLRVVHNGVLIQDNAEAPGPTRASMKIPEAAANPLMLQGDHGSVAFRNMYIRPLQR